MSSVPSTRVSAMSDLTMRASWDDGMLGDWGEVEHIPALEFNRVLKAAGVLPKKSEISYTFARSSLNSN